MVELELDRLEIEEKRCKPPTLEERIQYTVRYRHPEYGTITTTENTIPSGLDRIRGKIKYRYG